MLKSIRRSMGEYFDSNREESYLMYFDVNILYGVPLQSFEWANELNVNIIMLLVNIIMLVMIQLNF